MPFKKINVNKEINKRIANDEELKADYIKSQLEYEVIKNLVSYRKRMNISQQQLAKRSGLTQQMISRIETVGHSPALRNFLKYVDSLGLELKIVKK
ncbi:helix-turn-helix domain-containing protein [Biomaibacter acetigenes]|uniref:Helix-turn-helix domain-containing protein n=1 Tax=Biomaibacter acetigenes TaxID=2316383 RepID=A0A3G2R990_9FIRM|nr:helix-turn-helix transcriptional regulator [Biomaibacter acetigenes]AYO31965.1 helix-turn-helix domain-containing protein [Biomaibacter acetigenes]